MWTYYLMFFYFISIPILSYSNRSKKNYNTRFTHYGFVDETLNKSHHLMEIVTYQIFLECFKNTYIYFSELTNISVSFFFTIYMSIIILSE